VTLTGKLPDVARRFAGTVALSSVALVNVVVRSVVPNATLAPGTKLVPVRVSVCAAEPATTESGEICVRMGAGFCTSNVSSLLAPPPGGAVPTEMRSVPTAASLFDGMAPRSSVADTNVVASGAPSSWMTERATKLLPVMTMAGPTSPTSALSGVTDVTTGALAVSGSGGVVPVGFGGAVVVDVPVAVPVLAASGPSTTGGSLEHAPEKAPPSAMTEPKKRARPRRRAPEKAFIESSSAVYATFSSPLPRPPPAPLRKKFEGSARQSRPHDLGRDSRAASRGSRAPPNVPRVLVARLLR
jgi:hypothetical protein